MNPTVVSCGARRFLSTLSTLLLVGSACCPFGIANAQTTPAVSSESGKETTEPAVALSPFVVNADGRQGYLTNSSLLGSRINTPLIDTPSAISILTPEFLSDIGAKNIYDALDYTTSSNIDETARRFHNSFQTAATRVRGLRAPDAYTQDFFKVYWVADSYNVSDMGLARGANSILFGVGNPVGVFTATSKTAMFSNFNAVGLKFDSYGSKRAETDVNIEAVKGRVALRIALLDEDRRYFVQPAWNKTKAGYATLTARLVDKPGLKTSFTGNFEYREADRNFSQQWTPGNAITNWILAGRPTYPGARPGLGLVNSALNPVGVELSSNGDGGVRGGTQVILGLDGISYFYQQDQLSTVRAFLSPPPIRGDFTFRREADSPVKFNVNMSGPGAVNPFHGNRYTFVVDQQIGSRFFAQLAYAKHDYELMWGDPAVGIALYADVNQHLPNGSPNPNVGKFYVNSVQRPEAFHRAYDELRLTATYELDLTRRKGGTWLGRHQFSFLASKANEYQWHDVFTEQNTTPLPGASPDISDQSNRVFRRTYIDNNSQYLRGPSALESIVTGGLKSKLLARAVPDSNKSGVASTVETVQSRFWNGRIVTTVGFRQDSLERFNGVTAGMVRDPVTRDFARARTLPFSATPVLSRNLNSLSKGVVFHATKWAALTWNQSENFNPQATFLDLFGKGLPPQGGKSEDYGIRLSLPGGRLYASVNVFENSDVNNGAPNAYFRDVDVPYLRGLLILADGNANSITPINSFADTEDTVAKGHEVEIIANITKNWRLFMNYSHTDVVTTNVIPILGPWWKANLPRFMALNQNATLPPAAGVSGTVGAAIDWWNAQNINNRFAKEGLSPNAHRQNNYAAVTNYTFSAGPLKNFSVGGKFRYYGRSQYVNGLTDRAYSLVGLNLGYRNLFFKGDRLSRGVDWSLLVQVDNVLNFQGVIRSEAENGIWRQIPGASLAVNNSFKF
jgi:hypothetical protein